MSKTKRVPVNVMCVGCHYDNKPAGCLAHKDARCCDYIYVLYTMTPLQEELQTIRKQVERDSAKPLEGLAQMDALYLKSMQNIERRFGMLEDIILELLHGKKEND